MNTEQTEARRKLAYKLHEQGFAHDEIASQVDRKFRHLLERRYTAQDVAADLHAASAEIIDLESMSREQRKALMARRFQEIILAMRPAMLDGDTRAARIILNVMDREAALFGLDEPKKTIQVAFDPRAEVERYAKENNLSEDERIALLMQVEDMLREQREDARRG